MTSTSKQVNLNEKMNAYTGKITFIEPFKDLNYMVFTSNVKNIETEAYNLKNKSISSYDKRLEKKLIELFDEYGINNQSDSINTKYVISIANTFASSNETNSLPIPIVYHHRVHRILWKFNRVPRGGFDSFSGNIVYFSCTTFSETPIK